MSVQSRQEREKQQRITTILSAAKELYATKGYQETSLADIARACELGKATLYYYFPNKEAIYRELFLASLRAQFKRLSDSITEAGGLEELLTGILNAYVDWAHDDPQFFGLHYPWGKNAPTHIMDEPETCAELVELHAPIHAKMNTVLAGIDDRYDPQVVAGMIWTFMSGLAQKIHQGKTRAELQPEIDLYITGLTCLLVKE